MGSSPMGEAFSELKEIGRWAEARTHKALVEAMGAVLSTVSPETPRASSGPAATAPRPKSITDPFVLEDHELSETSLQ